jgi:hypothetical protein
MKVYLEPIDVEPTRGMPRRLRWRRRHYTVEQVADFWVSQTKWWSSEERRLYMRLVTNEGTMEIYRQGERWMMARVMD